jgi:hypothetical protein
MVRGRQPWRVAGRSPLAGEPVMAQLQIASEDIALLREILEAKLTDLAKEINRTDHLDFKNALRSRQRALERIVQQLASQSPTA